MHVPQRFVGQRNFSTQPWPMRIVPDHLPKFRPFKISSQALTVQQAVTPTTSASLERGLKCLFEISPGPVCTGVVIDFSVKIYSNASGALRKENHVQSEGSSCGLNALFPVRQRVPKRV